VRATGVSERWLQYYVNQKLGAVKREVQVTSKKKGKLIIQCDEMWSFVGCKGNKQWIWFAIDILTKEIVGVYIGKRDESGAIDCGIQYLPFTVNALSAIQTFGVLIK
jgi:hypothetical protein